MYILQERAMTLLVGFALVLIAFVLLVTLYEFLSSVLNRLFRSNRTEEEAPWMHPVAPADPNLPLYNNPQTDDYDRGRRLRDRHYRSLEREKRNYYGFFTRKL
jgi:Na+-transporting methylmalonyl-CoA/oxaloacetate decarboxylase gamma subunit